MHASRFLLIHTALRDASRGERGKKRVSRGFLRAIGEYFSYGSCEGSKAASIDAVHPSSAMQSSHVVVAEIYSPDNQIRVQDRSNRVARAAKRGSMPRNYYVHRTYPQAEVYNRRWDWDSVSRFQDVSESSFLALNFCCVVEG